MNTSTFKNFRCQHCKQLQCKYKLEGNFVIIEIKCYACNNLNYLTINLSNFINQIKTYEENKKSLS